MKAEVIKCDKCCRICDGETEYRTFVGNVLMGSEGGLIGNNIVCIEDGREGFEKRIAFKEDHFAILNNHYCVDCIKEILLLD